MYQLELPFANVSDLKEIDLDLREFDIQAIRLISLNINRNRGLEVLKMNC